MNATKGIMKLEDDKVIASSLLKRYNQIESAMLSVPIEEYKTGKR
jgi:hypothetical protein